MESEPEKITWVLLVGVPGNGIEKRIVGGGNVDNTKTSILNRPLSLREVHFGKHGRSESTVDGKKNEKDSESAMESEDRNRAKQ